MDDGGDSVTNIGGSYQFFGLRRRQMKTELRKRCPFCGGGLVFQSKTSARCYHCGMNLPAVYTKHERVLLRGILVLGWLIGIGTVGTITMLIKIWTR